MVSLQLIGGVAAFVAGGYYTVTILKTREVPSWFDTPGEPAWTFGGALLFSILTGVFGLYFAVEALTRL